MKTQRKKKKDATQRRKRSKKVLSAPPPALRWAKFGTSYQLAHVESLKLTGVAKFFQEEDWQALLEIHQKRLKKLILRGKLPSEAGINRISQLHNLVRLEFDCVYSPHDLLEGLQILSLVTNLHQLESLAIRNAFGISSDSLEHLAKSSTLTELDLTRSDCSFEGLPVSRPLWRTLILSGAPQQLPGSTRRSLVGHMLTEEGSAWSNVRFDNMPCLERLDVSFQMIRKFEYLCLPPTLTELHVQSTGIKRLNFSDNLHETLPSLRILDLRHNLLDCGALTEKHDLTRHRALEVLDITHCGLSRWEVDAFMGLRAQHVPKADDRLQVVRNNCGCDFEESGDMFEFYEGMSSSETSSSSEDEGVGEDEEEEEEEDSGDDEHDSDGDPDESVTSDADE